MFRFLAQLNSSWGRPWWVDVLLGIGTVVGTWLTAKGTGKQKKIELTETAQQHLQAWALTQVEKLTEARFKEQGEKITALEQKVETLNHELADRDNRLKQAAAACEACRRQLAGCKQMTVDQASLIEKQTKLIEQLKKGAA